MQHDHTPTPYFPENLNDYAPWVATHGLLASYGKCQCGCGGDAPVSRLSHARRGYRANHPYRYIASHNLVTYRPAVTVCEDSDCKYIALTKGKIAIIDATDYEWLCQWHWCASPSGNADLCYAERAIKTDNGWGVCLMHRVILDAPDDMLVDHVNGNGLDNRRTNLRLANFSQNRINSRVRSDNTSGYRGVSWHKRERKWQAYFAIGGKMKYLGLHSTAEEAARAYDRAAKEHYGEFARFNLGEL